MRTMLALSLLAIGCSARPLRYEQEPPELPGFGAERGALSFCELQLEEPEPISMRREGAAGERACASPNESKFPAWRTNAPDPYIYLVMIPTGPGLRPTKPDCPASFLVSDLQRSCIDAVGMIDYSPGRDWALSFDLVCRGKALRGVLFGSD